MQWELAIDLQLREMKTGMVSYFVPKIQGYVDSSALEVFFEMSVLTFRSGQTCNYKKRNGVLPPFHNNWHLFKVIGSFIVVTT